MEKWNWGPWPLYSVVFGYASNALSAWALLRYPEPRLTRGSRNYLVALTAWLVGGPTVMIVFAKSAWLTHQPPGAIWWPPVWPNRAAFDVLSTVFTCGCAALMLAFLVLLLRQLGKGSRQDRAVRLPVVVAGIAAAVIATAVTVDTALVGPSDEIFAVESVAELAIPVAFLVAIGQQRLMRLAGLFSGFHESASTARLLRDVLRLTMRDPDLNLLVWSDSDRGYLTVDGVPAGPHESIGPGGDAGHRKLGSPPGPLVYPDLTPRSTSTSLRRPR